jgi:ssDNA-binding Zn-finger/Zn-ribbon topoisomerase 1
MEAVQADLSIELNVTCPHCGDYFDLFEIENGRLNEEGQLIMQACPDGYWTETHGKFEETVPCPECGKDVVIKGIAW